ncbi:MAG: hypothetical protein LBG30_03870 [Odoribacteraceae bacterium]|jgi:hypothetical protein|nr:hypothetical protein [Odoribacteraceae bacterium]
MKHLLFILILASAAVARADNNARLHGVVRAVTHDQPLRGYISWNRHLFRPEVFHAVKLENAYAHYFVPKAGEKSPGVHPRLPVHAFECRFGDIEAARPRGNQLLEVQVRGGLTTVVRLREEVKVYVEQKDGSRRYVPWNAIEEILFTEPPADAPPSAHAPIAGIVRAGGNSYKGIVQWNEKRTTEHTLDGKTTAEEVNIPFKNVRAIVKEDNRCLVYLKSGNQVLLSNAVDPGQGIHVHVPGLGRVHVPWEEFASFEALPPGETIEVEEARAPERLRGVVEVATGERVEGIIAYDLDEALDIEMLDAKTGRVTYIIPLLFISEIEPLDRNRSRVTLVDGRKLVLGDLTDVNEQHDGVLIFRADAPTPRYFPWRSIRRISLLRE